MPEIFFEVRWPSGTRQDCYSPSSIIEQYLSVESDYAVADFVERMDTALNIASERVRQKYGFACSSALDQLAAIQERAAALSAVERRGPVRVLSLERRAVREARLPAKSAPPLKTHYPVVVIGGGQAGLAVSYCLKELGIEHVVLERERIAFSWREQRWDSFCLVTPNWQCRLPGFPYAGDDPHGFMLKQEIVEYIERYAASFGPPVHEGVDVLALRREGQGFQLETSRGRLGAGHVVLATGGYPVPIVPAYAANLPASILQLHSSSYANPERLPPGAVLVVGSGQSGCQIAEDLLLAGRQVHLCVGNAPRCARAYRGKDVVEWLERMGHYDITVDKHPKKEAVREKTNHYVTGRGGGHDIDLRQFALQGMRLYGPLSGIEGTRLSFAPGLRENLDAADVVYNTINASIDAYIEKLALPAPPPSRYEPVWAPEAEVLQADVAELGIGSVVWCIGFRSDYAWVELPAFDAQGQPVHRRGVSEVPGLYFIGLPWLHTWGSGRFSAVGSDARHIVDRIREALSAGLPAHDIELAALGS